MSSLSVERYNRLTEPPRIGRYVVIIHSTPTGLVAGRRSRVVALKNRCAGGFCEVDALVELADGTREFWWNCAYA